MANGITHEDRAKYLKCVIYDCTVLARSVLELRRVQDDGLGEIYKTAGAVKLRAIYDFLHRPTARDSIKRRFFDVYNPRVPQPMSRNWDAWLTEDSVNCYLVHLDRRRTEKTVPQPKFKRGAVAVIATAVRLLDQARVFADSIIQHEDFPGLDKYGKRYWSDFKTTLDQLH